MSEPISVPENPYVGPRAFTRTDPLFGRDVERVELLNILIAERIVLLYSPSGAGKTSLIQAGLVPALEAEQFRPLPPIRVNREPTEGDISPNRYLAGALQSLEARRGEAARIPTAELSGLTLDDYLTRRETESQADVSEPNDPFVLIFDQFEEILTVDPADLAVKEAFFTEVGAALQPPHRWALFAMREEYVAALDPYLRYLPTRLATTFRLGLLGRAAAKEAIQKPAAGKSVTFTDPAVDALLADLLAARLPDGTKQTAALSFVEPVQLQVVCRQFWDRLPWAELPVGDGRPLIEADHVAEYAKVDDALASYYADKVREVAAAEGAAAPVSLERQIREWIETNLITERGTRAQLRVGAEREQPLPAAAIAGLANAYLIRAEGRGDDRWYELAHDRLVQPVRESNAVWLRDHLEPVQLAARQWDATGRRREGLLRGRELRKARAWVDVNKNALLEREQRLLTEYLDASQREQQRLIAIMAGAVAAGLLIVLALVLWSYVSQRDAEAARQKLELEQRVNQSNLLASQAEAALQSGKLDLALLLAVESVQTSETPVAKRQLLQALSAWPGLVTYMGQQTTAPTIFAVSPNGQTAASAACMREESPCRSSEIRLWDLAAGQPAAGWRPLDGGSEIRSLAFSPDGRTIAAGTSDRGVVLWDVTTRESLGELLQESARAISSVAFSPDGQTLAAGTTGGAIVLWDYQAREPRATMPAGRNGHFGQVTSLAFGQNGVLASGGRDGSVLVWEGGRLRLRCSAPIADEAASAVGCLRLGAGPAPVSDSAAGGDEAPLMPLGVANPVETVALSADGQRLAAGASNGVVTVWDTESGALEFESGGGHDGVIGLAFSPDGANLAAVTRDRWMARWDLDNDEVLALIETPGVFTAAGFAPDGETLIASDQMAQVMLWKLAYALPLAQRFSLSSPVTGGAISRDGLLVATGDYAGEAAVWNAAGDRIWSPPPRAAPITSLALSPDARMLYAAERGGAVSGWEVSGDRAPIQFVAGSGQVTMLAMSPDGKTLATGNDDGSVRLWRLDQPAPEPITLSGNEAALPAVTSVAFSPDGRWLAAGRVAGMVDLWEMADPDTSRVLRNSRGTIRAVAFRPGQDTQLAESSIDVTSIVAIGDDHRVARFPSEANELITAIAFSADGATLAVATTEGLITLWDTATNLELGVLDGHDGAVPVLGFADNGVLLSAGTDLYLSRVAGDLQVSGSGGAVVLWSLSAESLRSHACQIAHRNLTPAEWDEFILNRPYQATCPEFPAAENPAAAGSGTGTGAATP